LLALADGACSGKNHEAKSSIIFLRKKELNHGVQRCICSAPCLLPALSSISIVVVPTFFCAVRHGGRDQLRPASTPYLPIPHSDPRRIKEARISLALDRLLLYPYPTTPTSHERYSKEIRLGNVAAPEFVPWQVTDATCARARGRGGKAAGVPHHTHGHKFKAPVTSTSNRAEILRPPGQATIQSIPSRPSRARVSPPCAHRFPTAIPAPRRPSPRKEPATQPSRSRMMVLSSGRVPRDEAGESKKKKIRAVAFALHGGSNSGHRDCGPESRTATTA
jgi:hypothetical protein